MLRTKQRNRSLVKRWLGAGALAAGLTAAGCLLPPTEQQIFEDLSTERQRTYEVWKTDREGQTVEAKLDGALNLDDAIKAALQYNKGLQQKLEERGVARGQVVAAYQLALPNVTLGAGYNRYQGINHDPWDNLNQYSTGLTVTQPLGQGASIPAAMRTARLYQALADENIRGEVQNVIYQTASAYYSVLIAQHLYDANNDAVISAKAHLRVVEERRSQGVDSEFEVLRTRVDVANFEAQKLIQQNAIDTARTELLKIIGVSQESEITLADKLKFEPMKPVFERAVEIAFKNRSDLFAADLDVNMQREAVRLSQSAWWPSFAATFTQSWSRPDPMNGQGHNRNHWGNDRWVAGVEGTWSLSAWDTAGKVITAKADLKKSEINRLDLHESALQQLRQTIYSVANAEELVQSQQLNREMATEALRLANVGYEYGAKTELDVIQARSALTTAVSNYYSALHDHTQARLSLQIAMGILGPRPGITGMVPRELPVRPGYIAEFAVSVNDFGETSPSMMPTTGGAVVHPEAAPAPAGNGKATPPAAPAPAPAATSATPLPALPPVAFGVVVPDPEAKPVVTPVTAAAPVATSTPPPAVATANAAPAPQQRATVRVTSRVLTPAAPVAAQAEKATPPASTAPAVSAVPAVLTSPSASTTSKADDASAAAARLVATVTVRP